MKKMITVNTFNKLMVRGICNSFLEIKQHRHVVSLLAGRINYMLMLGIFLVEQEGRPHLENIRA